MDINFELYKIFYYAAKNQSFSQAGEQLFITQSAVSQAIKNLENKLGGQLFFRKGRNVKLTWEGELLFKHVEQAYNLIKAAENKFSEMQNLDAGEIRMGASNTVCKYFLIPYLELFVKKFPKIKIQVINRTSSQLIQLLKTGVIDFCIATLPVKDPVIDAKEFMEVEDIFVASDRFPHLRGIPISLKDLSQYPILMLEKTSTTRQNIDVFLKQIGVEVVPEIELEDVDLLVEFARIGQGISHVLKESAIEEINKGRLFKVDLLEKLPNRKLGICTMKNVPLSRASTEFTKTLTYAARQT